MFNLSVIATCLSVAFIANSAAASCHEVSIISFSAELYMPESEKTIAAHAHQVLYAAPSVYNNLVWAAFEKSNSVDYDPRNVRAVVTGDKGVVYIDRFGKVRVGDQYGRIDANAFEEKLGSKCES